MRMHRWGAVIVIGLLAACGSGDDAEPAAEGTEESVSPVDEETAESAEEPTPTDDGANDATDDANDANDADAADDANDADEADDSNGSSVVNLGDIPQECRDLMGDFLREIEPVVQDIDWENATMADLAEFGDEIDAPVSEIDADMDAAGCNDLDFDGDDERGFELALELAKDDAPGVVGWLEFIRDISASVDMTADETADEPADVPANCDEALAAVQDLMDQTESMMELPVDQLLAASTTIQNITTVCSVDEMASLFNDPDFQAWSEG